MPDVKQQKREPQIIAGDLTNDELHRWLSQKAFAGERLHHALQARSSLQIRLAELNREIDELTAEAAIETIGGSASHPGCDLALIKLLLNDSKELHEIKPSHSTSQNIRIAESFLKSRSSVERGYQASQLLSDGVG
ncbi:hypothetical protein [Erwinia sp. S38]|uniref:hypothetical protein n=1 Tax=Erwinia sp. S38 TaxID=2769338 RepID=UPI00190C9F5A|nr:hypothetical protein [Erwinia sp. S38]MBK0003142.1 hypothetical protein [Erwinia sp. S38]